MWLMLNPSIANENVEDPTIRRCMGFTEDWVGGVFSGVEIVNLFGLVSTDPKKLLNHPDPVGPHNDAAIFEAAQSCSLVVCAWGDLKRESMRQRAVRISRELSSRGHELHVLRLTKNLYPAHPLYLPRYLMPQPWSGWESMR